jgi:hypothetical protein
MGLTASGYITKTAIDSAVRGVQKSFAPDVVRIGYSLEEDWMGHPAIFFRILLRDEATPNEHLEILALELPRALMIEVKTHENGLNAYFDYRSVSEQEQLQDPVWD